MSAAGFPWEFLLGRRRQPGGAAASTDARTGSKTDNDPQRKSRIDSTNNAGDKTSGVAVPTYPDAQHTLSQIPSPLDSGIANGNASMSSYGRTASLPPVNLTSVTSGDTDIPFVPHPLPALAPGRYATATGPDPDPHSLAQFGLGSQGALPAPDPTRVNATAVDPEEIAPDTIAPATPSRLDGRDPSIELSTPYSETAAAARPPGPRGIRWLKKRCNKFWSKMKLERSQNVRGKIVDTDTISETPPAAYTTRIHAQVLPPTYHQATSVDGASPDRLSSGGAGERGPVVRQADEEVSGRRDPFALLRNMLGEEPSSPGNPFNDVCNFVHQGRDHTEE